MSKSKNSTTPMTVALTIAERYALLGIIPSTGNLVNMRALSEFTKSLYPTEAEVAQYKIEMKDNALTWQDDSPADIHVGEIVRNVIVATLKDLDKKEQLTSRHLTLCDKFLSD